jgi:hypothetical protein
MAQSNPPAAKTAAEAAAAEAAAANEQKDAATQAETAEQKAETARVAAAQKLAADGAAAQKKADAERDAIKAEREAAQTQLHEAQKTVDTHWSTRDESRAPLRAQVVTLVNSLEGVTGLQPGPGMERLIDLFLDFAEQHADDFGKANEGRIAALKSQEDRDLVLEKMPDLPPPPAPTLLSDSDPSAVRAWLLTANDNDVRTQLGDVLSAADQNEWAKRLMAWARADGNVAQVFAAINEYIVPEAVPTEIPAEVPTGGVGATSTFPSTPVASAPGTNDNVE